MKKYIFAFYLIFVSFFAFGNVSIKSGSDLIYSDGTISFSDFYLKSDFSIKNNFFATGQINSFNLSNLNFTLNDFADYSLQDLNIITGFSCFGMKFDNPIIKSIGIDFYGANSTAENGRIYKGRANYLNLIPELENTYGIGGNLQLPWNLGLSAQKFYLAAKTVSFMETEDSVEEVNAFSGKGDFSLFDFSKQFLFENDSLNVHAGSFFGKASAGGELFLTFFLQKRIVLGVQNFNFTSLYGIISYSHWWKFIKLNLTSGMVYFPQMNLSYFFKDGTFIIGWRYKYHGTEEKPLSLDLLKNYGIIPLSVGGELKIPLLKTNLSINFAKSIIIPVDFNASKENSIISVGSTENLKEILLRSGLSLSFSLNF